MAEVAKIDQRKDDHIDINLGRDVQSSQPNGLDRIRLIHEALPEIDLAKVDITTDLFRKTISAPLLISSMTGGTDRAMAINTRLAEAAQAEGIALGVGSQRAAIENDDLVESFAITRRLAPDIPLFANLGAVQLNYGYGLNECQRAIDMLQADALILHLNSLQEAVQEGGDGNFSGLAGKIEMICKKINLPIIVKEVGWGISNRSAKLLADSGVTAIDVAGAGGTSWSQVEKYRAKDDLTRAVAEPFVSWGLTTVESILNVKNTVPGMRIFASGGLRDGLDLVKCIALGASLGGMAAPFLRTGSVSTEKTIRLIKRIKNQIRIALFATGTANLQSLSQENILRAEYRFGQEEDGS